MQSGFVVLFGGTSRERRVSVASAQHLASADHRIRAALGPDVESRWWFWRTDGGVDEVDRVHLAAHGDPFGADLAVPSQRRWASIGDALDAIGDDVAVLALHGGDGENGVVQGLLEDRGVRFTGSGSACSRLAFDKDLARRIVGAAGIAVPAGVVVDPADAATWPAARDLLAGVGAVVVKPVAEGSSFGLSFVRDLDRLEALLDALGSEVVERYLVEELLTGRELTVGVLDDHDVRALPASEVILRDAEAFDFDAKYRRRGADEVTPAEVSDEVMAAVGDVGLRAHRALGCAGYSRTDVIVAADATVRFLETNTLPGLTQQSFIPQQLAAAGIGFADFIAAEIRRVRRC